MSVSLESFPVVERSKQMLFEIHHAVFCLSSECRLILSLTMQIFEKLFFVDKIHENLVISYGIDSTPEIFFEKFFCDLFPIRIDRI